MNRSYYHEVLLNAETYVATYYFINPNYIFNGNRIAIVKEYILKRKPVLIED